MEVNGNSTDIGVAFIEPPEPGTITYSIGIGDFDNGVITSSVSMAEVSEVITLKITPNESFTLSSISVKKNSEDGDEVPIWFDTTQKYAFFVMPAFDVIVTAVFSAESGPQITELEIDASSTQLVSYAGGFSNDATFTLTPTPSDADISDVEWSLKSVSKTGTNYCTFLAYFLNGEGAQQDLYPTEGVSTLGKAKSLRISIGNPAAVDQTEVFDLIATASNGVSSSVRLTFVYEY